MPRPRRWRELLPGVLSALAVVLAAAAVLVFARVGALHGDTVTIYAPTSEARGVMRGTEVWLAGQKVGLVKDVRFRPVSVDTGKRLVIELEILEHFRSQLRLDSYAQIRSGSTLIGTPVVWVAVGSSDSPELVNGDTLSTRPQNDAEGMTSQLALASQQFPAIIENVRLLNAQLDAARGTAGAILNLDEGSRQLSVLGSSASSLMTQATHGTGSIALALHGGDLTTRASRAMARADSVRALVSSPSGALGRFRRDSTLLRNVAEVRDEVSIVRGLLANASGTAGRVLGDSAIVRQLAQTEAALSDIISDIRRRPLRYIAF
jgi:phospholipid/cholesterol/gamma-HCH transport system substrate-binding protein